jgi:hypothetical protein
VWEEAEEGKESKERMRQAKERDIHLQPEIRVPNNGDLKIKIED